MIRFKRDGTDVIIEVDSNLNVKKQTCLFKHSCNNECEAELLANHLNNEYEANQNDVYITGFSTAIKEKNGKSAI